MAGRVRGTYGKPWSTMTQIEVTPDFLHAIGRCMVESMVYEAKKDFAKRGWSENDPMGGPALGESFSYQIRGKSTVELMSTFYGIPELMKGDIPERKMTWLTQEKRGRDTRERGGKKVIRSVRGDGIPSPPGGRVVARGAKSPLIIPIEQKDGTVVFRMAPLKTQDAWIHPAIAKFTFAQRAARKAKAKCVELIKEQIKKQLLAGDPTR